MQKPPKTLADYLVVAISPILIMLLVGSLGFFLIQVFYRGETVDGIRWLMFWFDLAIVLVSRVGIEQGKEHARVYGAALAIATWFYLAHTLRTPVLGAMLLAIIWWCAHRLTVDCTLISEDEDASGEGVLQGLWRKVEKSLVPPEPKLKPPRLSPLELLAAADLARRRSRPPSRPPGRSVVFFSLAALPLFGIGQLFLPADEPQARRIGFAFLALYLGAALSLLVTTSFLGLRRYLRQRSVEMPASVTFGWIKFGALLAGGVLLLALILPRPGANNTWKNFAYRIEHKEHPASDYALPFNAPGEGEGAPTDQPIERNRPGADSRKAPAGSGTQSARNDGRPQSNPRNQTDQPAADGGVGNQGSSGQGGQPGGNTRSRDDNRAPSRQTVRVRDVTPSGGADQSSDKDQPAGSAGSGEPNHDGAGHQMTNADRSQERSQPAKDSQRQEPKQERPSVSQNKPPDQPEQQQPENASQTPKQPSRFLYNLLRVLLILALSALFIWLLIRYRKAIVEMIRSFIAAVRDFFRKLFSFRRRKPAPKEEVLIPAPALEPFAAFENPFVTGRDKIWSPERLLFYTYEAIQAWVKEQGIEIKPQQTPREFCSELIGRFPDFGPELEQFSFYYGHAAFARRLPNDFETESLRRLWQYLGDSIMVVASR